MSDKIFSVIIPVYNSEKTIERVLASLISNRDYIHEVIIVNDNCTDDTLSKIENFNLFFNIIVLDSDGYHNPSIARKTGLLKASGKWITFIDADDCIIPNSLYYVSKQLDDCVLLHCQTIYYESGDMNPSTIGHCDFSCGGNFYKREYLIDNSLLPHDTLKMSEDEYFNNKIDKFITYCDVSHPIVKHYDYPVYEVHHDLDFGKSFALSNWADYCIKYHLLAQQYITDDFIKYNNMHDILLNEYINSFIFCYFLFNGLLEDDDINIDYQYYKKYFKKQLLYFVKKFHLYKEYMVDYYISHGDTVDELYSSAIECVGFDFSEVLSFKDFVKEL